MELLTGASLTSVAGVLVGHWTDVDQTTGCTVVVLPESNVVAGEIRGAAPGSRETALLEPGMSVEHADAIVLSGGSAFGLAAADGVMEALAAHGRGHPTSAGPVPIVPSAVIFDLEDGRSARPDRRSGRAAFEAASSGPVAQGSVGAGAGAVVGRWRGVRHPGGVGSAAVGVDGAIVAALVVANGVGDGFTLDGEPLTGGSTVPSVLRSEVGLGENTTLVVVATDARADRAALTRLAIRSQDALSVCLRPAHTRFDGDACFVSSCGDRVVAAHDLAEASFWATGAAIESALRIAGSPPEPVQTSTDDSGRGRTER